MIDMFLILLPLMCALGEVRSTKYLQARHDDLRNSYKPTIAWTVLCQADLYLGIFEFAKVARVLT